MFRTRYLIPAPLLHCYMYLQHYGLVMALRNAKPFVRELLFGAERKAEKDEEFDRQFGTDTATIVWPWQLSSLSRSGPQVHPYGTVSARRIRDTLAGLPLERSKFTFVDIGSGKGRAVLVASEFPFARIVGVELAPELHQVAQRNLNLYRSASQLCRNFDLQLADAAQFRFPSEPLVLFMFNPFGKETMSQVLENLEASLEHSPRPVFVIYVNPEFDVLLRRACFLRKLPSPAWYSLYASFAADQP